MSTYDPQKVTFLFSGNLIVGFAAGSMIKAMRNEDAYSLTVGAQGDGCRVRNANKSGRFECTLRTDSPSNDVLMAIALLDESAGTGIGEAMVKDAGGSALAHAQNAWIVKVPDLERAKELGEVTWIFETDLLELTQGGITSP